MRAIVADRAGPPSVLVAADLPDPVPGPGYVRVAVRVAAITFVDTQLRAGRSPGPPVSFPSVLGNGVAGVVEAIGEDGDPAWIGVDVVTSTGGKGGYASKAIASVGDLHRLPAGVDLRTAAAVLADGRTALGLSRVAGINPGEIVVVTAAAGGLGGILVQLARNAGAKVIALAGGERKVEHVLSLGADVAVDYLEPGWPVRLDGEAPDEINVVFDGVGGETSYRLFERIRIGGRYLLYGGASGAWGVTDQDAARERHVSLVPMNAAFAGPAAMFALVEDALALAAAGAIRPTIGQIFPLERAADAHAAIEARETIGKTLLIVE